MIAYRFALPALFAVFFAACSSSSESAAPACDPGGTYSVTPKRVGGDCPDAATSETPYTVTVTTEGADIKVGYGTSGIVCPGTVKDCKATVACETGLRGGGTGTIQLSWTFDAAGLHGSQTKGYLPTGVAACNVEYDEKGTKK